MNKRASKPTLDRIESQSAKSDGEFRLLGYKLSAWSTVVSLVLSLGAFSITAYYRLFAAPVPQLLPPSAVEIVCDHDIGSDNCDPELPLQIVAASVVWTNRTDSSKSYMVSQTYVEMTFFPNKKSEENPSQPRKLFAELYGEGEAVPMQIAAQQLVAQRTTFAARREEDGSDKNFIKFGEFRKSVTSGEIRKIRFRFYSALENNKSVEAKCDYFIDDAFIGHLSDITRRDYQRTCFPI